MAAEFFRTDHLTIKHTALFVHCPLVSLSSGGIAELLSYNCTYRFSAPPTPHWFQYYIEPTGFPSFTARWCIAAKSASRFWESLNQLSPVAGWSNSISFCPVTQHFWNSLADNTPIMSCRVCFNYPATTPLVRDKCVRRTKAVCGILFCVLQVRLYRWL